MSSYGPVAVEQVHWHIAAGRLRQLKHGTRFAVFSNRGKHRAHLLVFVRDSADSLLCGDVRMAPPILAIRPWLAIRQPGCD